MRGLEGIPVIPSARVPRDSAVVIDRTVVVMHPLLIIEIECGDDLNLRSARALEWIQQRAARQADAAIERLDAMYADTIDLAQAMAYDLRKGFGHRLDSIAAVMPIEGNYRWPIVVGEAGDARA